MNTPAVRFDYSGGDSVPSSQRVAYQDVLQQAIEVTRPAGESWTIAMRLAEDGAMLTFEFARGTEGRRSFTYLPDGDDAKHSGLFKTACQFLRVHWAGAIAAS